MFYKSYTASSAIMSADVRGGMKNMVMFRHFDMNTKMGNQRKDTLGFLNPFNFKSYHFENDVVSAAEVDKKICRHFFRREIELQCLMPYSYVFSLQLPMNFAIGVDIIRKGLNINWFRENSTETINFLMNSKSSSQIAGYTFMEDVRTQK